MNVPLRLIKQSLLVHNVSQHERTISSSCLVFQTSGRGEHLKCKLTYLPVSLSGHGEKTYARTIAAISAAAKVTTERCPPAINICTIFVSVAKDN